jgi:predicted transcriptional regulator
MKEENNRNIEDKRIIEVPDSVSVVFMGKYRCKERRDFVKVYGEALEWLAINITSLTAMKVLNILIANVDYDGNIRLSMVEIGHKLGMKKQQVNTAIRELADKNIIQIHKTGRGNQYSINPDIAWKNTIDEKAKRSKFKLIKNDNGDDL